MCVTRVKRTPQRVEMWWYTRSGCSGGLPLTTLAKAAVLAALCCGFKPASSHVFMHICAHTELGSVWVKSRPSPCGLLGFSNTHAPLFVLPSQASCGLPRSGLTKSTTWAQVWSSNKPSSSSRFHRTALYFCSLSLWTFICSFTEI